MLSPRAQVTYLGEDGVGVGADGGAGLNLCAGMKHSSESSLNLLD